MLKKRWFIKNQIKLVKWCWWSNFQVPVQNKKPFCKNRFDDWKIGILMVGLERLALYQNVMQSFLSTHTALKSEEMCNLIQVSTYLTFLRSKVKKNCLSHDNIIILTNTISNH